MAKGFKDHFSGHAAGYAEFRPVYPARLAQWLAEKAPRRGVAWDCGCGSGQLSALLAERFESVIATDASAEQLARAKPHPRIEYRAARVEESGIAGDSVDLVVAAQAAHWFDLPKWFEEIRRVAREGAVVAMVTYARAVLVDPKLDALLVDFYDRALAGCWPPERAHVENGYRDLPFPFAEFAAPEFTIEVTQPMRDLIGYVDTWSAIRELERRGKRAVFE